MRPRELPAEDLGENTKARARIEASMRPRELPAEDVWHYLDAQGVAVPARFNEAAGVTRGRRQRNGTRRPSHPASMRPRELPAEDASRPHHESPKIESLQ